MKTGKKRIHRAVCYLTVLFALLCSSVSMAGTTFYSSVSALQSGIDGATSGDILVLNDGTYNDNTLTISTENITVRAETPGGVYLDGSNVIIISGDYVTFSGFQFTSGDNRGDFVITVSGDHNKVTQCNWNGYKAKRYIEISSGSQYNEVSFCNFEDKPANADLSALVHVDPHATIPGYHVIRYCSFQNMPGNGGDYGNEPIKIGSGAHYTEVSRTTVEYCYFNDTGLADSETISIKCRENTIRYNTFTNQQNAKLVFRNGDDNKAYGNFFIGAGGIRLKEASNIDIYNNYFENSGTGSEDAVKYVYVQGGRSLLDDITFTNNTFVECEGRIDIDECGSNNTWNNNIFKKTSGDIFTNIDPSISWDGNIYQGTLGVTISSGMTYDDPELTLNADDYYGLSSTSPCIDAGVSIPAIQDFPGVDDDPSLLLDISGQTRPSSAALKDVGADEYTTGSTINRPLILSDVGPSYLNPPVDDFDAPTPDPMTFATVPYSTGSSSISMTATTAIDASGVQYYFTCTAGGGNNSGWVFSETYEDTGLTPETQYSYTVTARDTSPNQNTTAASDPASATTDSAGNNPPTFTSDPINETDATEDAAYSSTLADDATDPDVGDTLFFSKVTGPAWLSVAGDGTLSGTPGAGDVGLNSWTVQVDDDSAAYDQATLEITVNGAGGGGLNFSDGFESGNFSAGGWTTSGSTNVKGGSSYSGSYGAELKKAASIEKAISTVGSTNIQVGYARKTAGYDGGETLDVEWSTNGSTWNLLESTADTSWAVQSWSLPAGAEGQAGFRVRFITNASANNEKAHIDDVTITGTGGGGGNNPPAFTSDPIVETNATEDAAYSSSIADDASDPDSDPMTFSKISGPAWLVVASSGALSGTPGAGDVGLNSFTVEVDDGQGGTDQATLEITVDPAGGTTDIFVFDIAMTSGSYGGNRYSGIATITIHDEFGAPVSNATVSVDWSGATSGSDSDVTDGSGQVVIESAKVKNGGTYTVTVTDVSAAGYNYNSALNNEDFDSITAP